jgi:putative spermidine/putrescine transport system substrate-binding protein
MESQSDRTRIGRREWLADAVATAATISVARLGRASTDDVLVYSGFGGSSQDVLREGLMAPFSKATGIRVVDTGPPDLAKIKAMVETKRVEWDVVQVEADFVHRGRTENLLERLDYKVISTRDVLPEAIDDYGITFQFGATSIAYRTDTFPAGNGPKSWADFWDVRRFPGRRALPKQTYHLFPAALAADGVPRDKLYPIDVDRVLRSLERIRPHVVKFFEGFPQAAQLIADKEVDMAASSVTRMVIIQQKGSPVYIEMNQAIPWGDAWVIPRGAPHKDAAMKFIGFAIQNEEGLALKAKKTYTGMANSRTTRLLDAETARSLVTTPENFAKTLVGDDRWWAANRARMDQLMTAWLLK